MNRKGHIFAVLMIGLLLGFLAGQFFPVNRTPDMLSPDEETGEQTAVDESGEVFTDESPTTPPSALRGVPAITATTDDATTPSFTQEDTPVTGAYASTPDSDTVSIPRRFMSKIQCQVFQTASNCVTDDIVELLQIKPEERERLNRLIATTRASVEVDEMERATVTEQSPTRVVLKITANPEAGRDIENAYLAGVQEALGDRASQFLDRARIYDSMMFSSFGRNDTTLTVTRDENSSLLRVQSRQEYTTPGGQGSSTSVTMSDQMPARWKKFFQTP